MEYNPPTIDGYEGGVADAAPVYEEPPGYDQVLEEKKKAAQKARIKEELDLEKVQRAIQRQNKIQEMSSLQRWREEQIAEGHHKKMSRNQLLILLNQGVRGEVIDQTFGFPETRQRWDAEWEASNYCTKLWKMGIKVPIAPEPAPIFPGPPSEVAQSI